MKKNVLFFILIFPLFIFLNCSDNDKEEDIIIEDTLAISTTELYFKEEGGSQSFEIKSNSKWEISIDEENSHIKINPQTGTGDALINVEILENTKEEIFSGSLTIKTLTKTKTLTIKQDALIVPIETKEHYYPLVTIKTDGNEPVTSKDYYLNATITIEQRDEKGVVTEKLIETETEIKGRGNSTWGMEKKPYRLKLNKSAEILGMPKNKHWVLLANYSDKTLMRNELAFEVSRRMGFVYTPRMQYVDVVFNGDYIGNYMLCEHIRIDKDRVNIPELEPEDEDITGGYLLEIDERMGEPEWFKTNEAQIIFCIKRPEDIPANQKEYISSHIQKIEDVLYGKNGFSTLTDLPDYIDLNSFIDYYLLNELSKNVDGNLRLSTFVYKNRGDDKIYFGPVWDYDIAFGNVNYSGGNLTNGWMVRDVTWYQQFFQYPEFDKMVKDRWIELRKGNLSDLNSFIDNLAKKMSTSQKKNFERWPILNKEVWPNAIVTGSYQGEVDYLKDWLRERILWMDKELK